MKNDKRISRRAALKVGATLAAGGVAGGSFATADAENLRRFERQPVIDPNNRIVLKGGTIVTMDPKVSDLAVPFYTGSVSVRRSRTLRLSDPGMSFQHAGRSSLVGQFDYSGP